MHRITGRITEKTRGKETGRMKQDRCIFCMEKIEGKGQTCSHCGKGIWQYRWQQGWLQPMTVLKERYVLGVTLGQGAFGITYLAWDEELQRKTAIKVYSAEHDLSAFEREVEILKESGKIDGLVEVYDFFEEDGQGFLVMEYLSGGTLKEYLAKKAEKKLQPTEAVNMLFPVMTALMHIHSVGIIHCDISADNIMLDEHQHCRLIDLGAARWNEKLSAERLLKEAYGAPEQYANPEKIGPWTDIYSFCALLYELMTGERIPPAASRIRKDDLKAPSVYAKIPADMEQAILRGLELEIQKRYFSMEMLMSQLGLPVDEIMPLCGAVRHFWGQLWIRVSAQGKFAGNTSGRLGNKRRWKYAAAGILTLLAVFAACLGAQHWYYETHEYENYKKELRKARAYVQEHPDNQIVAGGSEDYEEIVEYIREKGEPAESYYEATERFAMKEAELVKLGIPYNDGRKLYLDWETLRDHIFYLMDVEEKRISSEERSFNSSISIDRSTGGKVRNYSYVQMSYNYEYIDWEADNAAVEENIGIVYDPVDERGIHVSFRTDSLKRGIWFLTEVFPACCPEGYLTEDEAQEILTELIEEEDYPIVGVNERSWVRAFSLGSEEKTYYIGVAAENSSLYI